MKNRKNNRTLLIIALAFILLLNGCSLAKKEAQSDAKDTLIGAFITDDYLDGFNIEAYLDDNASGLPQDQDIVINDSGRYTDPLYATINHNNSEDPSDWDISFDGIKGLSFLAPVWTDENGETYRASRSSDGICDMDTKINLSDNVNETTLSATIYCVPKVMDKEIAYFTNLVYQTADGKIYTVPNGHGFSTSWPISEGENMSTSFSDQTDLAEKGTSKTDKTTITIQFSIMYEPVTITLAQMDKENKLIKQEEFTPGKLPEQLSAEKETAYLLVKTEKKAPDGSIKTLRSIYEKEETENENFLETFYAMDNGIVAKQYTEIIWK